jgi:hypothetical protein
MPLWAFALMYAPYCLGLSYAVSYFYSEVIHSVSCIRMVTEDQFISELPM